MMSDTRERQLRHWNAVASGWEAWFEWTAQNFSPVTKWLDAQGVWKPGTHVLDVACGAGYPALLAAARVGPSGRVVAADVSTEMVAAAKRRATRLGADNVTFIEGDAEDLRFHDDTFDAVTNVYGMMFCNDLQRAVAEARRVLKPGGSLAIVSWDEPSKSPFFSVIGGVAARVLSFVQPAAGDAGPFRLASAIGLEDLFRGEGFSHIIVETVRTNFEFASSEDYCRAFHDLAWKSRLDALSAADAARFRQAVSGAVRPHVENGRLRLTAASLCAWGVKPGR